MRKLEGLVKEIVDEMAYLQKREERFSTTNGAFHSQLRLVILLLTDVYRVDKRPCAVICTV